MILRTALWLMLAAPALGVSTGAASEPDSTEAVEQPPPSDAPAVPLAASDDLRNLAAETVQLMQQAQAGLADGPLTDDTNTLQAGILERLQQLAELARRQATKSASGQSQASGSRSAAAANAGDGRGAAGRNDNAAESSEAATGSAESAAGDTTAANLATSVWGHLPARQRDRMRSRFSERFLPQYEQLVRQYYEALADEASADP